MPFVNGTEFFVIVNGQTIGKSVSASINTNQDLPDASTKDDNGWKKHIQGLRNGEVIVNALSAYDSTVNYGTIAELILLRSRVNFVFGIETFRISGFARVMDVEEVSQAENVVSYDLTLKIDGILDNSANDFLLLEDGFFLLLEDGSFIIL